MPFMSCRADHGIHQIDGAVYDVSKGKAYQPGGAYHHLWVNLAFVLSFISQQCSVGVDAARAFGTGCFATHRTHDLRGLTEAEIEVRSIVAVSFSPLSEPPCFVFSREFDIGNNSMPIIRITWGLEKFSIPPSILITPFRNLAIRLKHKNLIMGVLTSNRSIRSYKLSAYHIEHEVLTDII